MIARIVAVAATSAALVAASVVPAGAAAEVHPGSLVKTNWFSAGGYSVEAFAWSGRAVGEDRSVDICLEAIRTTRSRDLEKTTFAYACTTDLRYSFDALDWTASADGSAIGYVGERTRRLSDGAESSRVISRASTVRFRLRWTGEGDPRFDPFWSCGGFVVPRCHDHGVESSRAAVVSGRIRFDGLGLRADVPPAQSGWMAWR